MEEIEKLKKEIEELEKKLKETEELKNQYLAGWQRARADLINYKKEEMERIGEWIKYANENLILKILPILDNFEIAKKKIPDGLKENENVKGIFLIEEELKRILKNEGLEEIEVLGKKFDPAISEVVEEIETDEYETGTVVEEVQKGYKFHYHLLRPAKVKVAK